MSSSSTYLRTSGQDSERVTNDQAARGFLSDELLCSAREAAEERGQLGSDSEDGPFDDADDGSDEAGKSRHENVSYSFSAAAEL